MTQELQARFIAAYTNIAMLNKMLANYYISEYWNDAAQDFDWNEIDENVVKEIEKDSQFQSSF
jgi:hypothetical protein